MRTTQRKGTWIKRTVAAFATVGVLTAGIMGYKEVGKPTWIAMTTDSDLLMKCALKDLLEQDTHKRFFKTYFQQLAVSRIVKSTKTVERELVWRDAFDETRNGEACGKSKNMLMKALFGLVRLEDSEAIRQLIKLNPEVILRIEQDMENINGGKIDERTSGYANMLRALVVCFSSSTQLRLRGISEIEGHDLEHTRYWLGRTIRLININTNGDISVTRELMYRVGLEMEKTRKLEEQLKRYQTVMK